MMDHYAYISMVFLDMGSRVRLFTGLIITYVGKMF